MSLRVAPGLAVLGLLFLAARPLQAQQSGAKQAPQPTIQDPSQKQFLPDPPVIKEIKDLVGQINQLLDRVKEILHPLQNTAKQLGDDLKASSDNLVKASDKFSDGMVKSTDNIAKASKEFDPLGLKTAFNAIREQNQTIQGLLDANTKRHHAEAAAVQKQVDSLTLQLYILRSQANADGKMLMNFVQKEVILSCSDNPEDKPKDSILHAPLPKPNVQSQAKQEKIQILPIGAGQIISVVIIPASHGDEVFRSVKIAPSEVDPKNKDAHYREFVNIAAVGGNAGQRTYQIFAIYTMPSVDPKKQ